jgi:hypothetical protein
MTNEGMFVPAFQLAFTVGFWNAKKQASEEIN